MKIHPSADAQTKTSPAGPGVGQETTTEGPESRRRRRKLPLRTSRRWNTDNTDKTTNHANQTNKERMKEEGVSADQ
jgi:hypothetical protein